LLDEEESTIQFLLKNIYREKQEDGSANYAWRFNLDVLADDIEEMGLPILTGSDVETLFLYGTQSKYVLGGLTSPKFYLYSQTQLSRV
jgi:hypothetical protein